MYLKKFDTKAGADEGAWLHLRHPDTDHPLFLDDDTKTKPLRIKLLGVDSDTYRRTAHRAQNQRLKAVIRAGRKPTLSAEEMEDSALDLLVACTENWENIVIEEGQDPLPFSKSAVRDLYQNFPWIRDQVDLFVGDRGNFLPK